MSLSTKRTAASITAGWLITTQDEELRYSGLSDDAARTPTAEEVALAGSIRPNCIAQTFDVIVAGDGEPELPLLQGTPKHLLAIHGTTSIPTTLMC